MPMLKGENINGYIIQQDFIVAGGMGKISFARKGGKEYFIKEFLFPKYPLPDSPGNDKVKAQRLKDCEAFEKHHKELNRKISSKVSLGGNLVFAVDFFRYGACYYKVTEKVDTTSMTCEDISRLPFSNKLIIAKSVCHSLSILHSLNIVHGDLKPDNILIKKVPASYSGKLIDFDDSYFSGNPPKDRDSLVGTPEYYSPEQADYIMDEDEETDGRTLTCKSDIFTLGIILCEYFTGQKPLLPVGSKGAIWSVAKEGKSFTFSKRIQRSIAEVITKMLRPNANERPTIREVFDVLKNAREDEPQVSSLGDRPHVSVEEIIPKEPKLRIRFPSKIDETDFPKSREKTPRLRGKVLGK